MRIKVCKYAHLFCCEGENLHLYFALVVIYPGGIFRYHIDIGTGNVIKEDMDMLTILFMIFLFAVFGELFILALKAAWGIGKILMFFVFLPFIIVGGIIAGLLRLVFPVLVIFGIVYLIKSARVVND